MSRRPRFAAHRFVIATLFLCMLLLVPASQALARSYSIDKVDMDVTISDSGAVHVREVRRFSFSGDFNGVYWKLVQGSYEGRGVAPVVAEVGELRNGQFVSFAKADTQGNETYQINDYSFYDEVKIFSKHRNEDVDFVIDYTYENLASRWEDTSELYWKFVSDGWDEPSRNVTCTVHLPVPAGASVMPEKNVRAWGHGPLDATVAFSGNDVVYSVPYVGTTDFAEARITFPEEWLPNAKKQPSSKLSTILEEEKAWADQANAQRARARLFVGGLYGLMGLSGVGALAFAVIKLVKYKKAHTPLFNDTYYRDVPSNDHPAVLGALYRGGSPGKEDFTASLMRLADNGKIQLDLVNYTRKGLFGRVKEEQDYRLLELEHVEGGLRGDVVVASCDKIDRSVMKFLFRTVAGHHKLDDDLKGPHGENYVLASYFGDVASERPQTYENGYDEWKSAVTSSLEARGFMREEHGKTGQGACIAMGTISIIVGIALGIAGLIIEASLPVVLLLMLLNIAGGVLCIVAGVTMTPRSREAIELNAQLHALKRWFKDFTKLDEAVPSDVVLWNRLLVMATVLGVADDVIRQLKVAMPQLMEDPYFYTYGWYYYGSRRLGSPADVMGASFGQGHSVSAGKLASSSSSSGGGGGGGFSGGGGGGFGGGGGGGAF